MRIIANLIVLIFLLFMVWGCGSSSFNMKPTNAGIHELYYAYYKNGELYPSFGVSGTKADLEEVDFVRVYIPRKAKGYLLVTEDGDSYKNIKIDGEDWIDVDVTGLEGRKTKTLGFSLATTNYGVSTGRLFLVGNLNVDEELETEYTCPYKVDNGIIGTCIRPSGFSFYLNVKVTSGAGLMKVFTNGACSAAQVDYTLQGDEQIQVKLLNTDKGMCSVSVETRQNKVNGVWTKQQAKILNINYFDSGYIGMGKPIIEGGSGDYKVYASDKIKSYYLNEKQSKKKPTKKYVKCSDEQVLAVTFDEYGRVSWDSTYKLGESNE